MNTEISRQISVGFVKPPLSQHQRRGIGIFAQNLIAGLRKNKNIHIVEIPLGHNTDQFDIIHYPYFDPFFLTLPFNHSRPTVVTVHDLIPLKLSGHYPVGIKGKIKWELQKRALKNATHICTDSYSSEEDIKKYLGIEESKISVVYGGVNESFYLPVSQKTIEETAKKFSIDRNFILYVGDINYNKNIPGLLTAFSQVVQNENIDLVLVGPAFIRETVELEEIKKRISDLSLEKRVKLIDYVSDTHLRCLYRMASVYIQPSFAEGFGLPVLEAMASGCAVVSSVETSLKEICGESAVEINPYDTDNIAEGIKVVLTDKTLRERNIQKGMLQAKKFTWEDAAKKTGDIYFRILQKNEKKT